MLTPYFSSWLSGNRHFAMAEFTSISSERHKRLKQ